MIDAERGRIVAILLAHYPTAQGIYLFGSHAAGTAWPTSDVDVAVLCVNFFASFAPFASLA